MRTTAWKARFVSDSEQKNSYDDVTAMIDFIAYADGKKDLIEISETIHQPISVLIPIIDKLIENQIIRSERNDHWNSNGIC